MSKKFDALSPKGKRIAILKDVLKQIELKRFEPGDTYGVLRPKNRFNTINDFSNLQTNDALRRNKIVCEGCIKASLFISHVMFNNHFTVIDARLMSNANILNRLSDIFSEEELNLIESAYERQSMNSGWGMQCAKAIQFGENYKNRKNRLIGIINNMLKNDGYFKP